MSSRIEELERELDRLRAALVRSAMSSHLARHRDSSAQDWVSCEQASRQDARAALGAEALPQVNRCP